MHIVHACRSLAGVGNDASVTRKRKALRASLRDDEDNDDGTHSLIVLESFAFCSCSVCDARERAPFEKAIAIR